MIEHLFVAFMFNANIELFNPYEAGILKPRSDED